MRVCRRGHEAPTGGRCKQCDRDRQARYRVQGREADRQARWYRKRYADPVFHQHERERWLARYRLPEVQLARRLGVGVKVAREIMEVAR